MVEERYSLEMRGVGMVMKTRCTEKGMKGGELRKTWMEKEKHDTWGT